MRVAVLSDIHANLPALEAVARDLKGQRVDEVWSLGDVVGYGGQPTDTLNWVEQNAKIRLQGNHDYATATGETDNFNPIAREAALAHRTALGKAALDRLVAWKPLEQFEVNGETVLLVHGSPDDPLWEYVTPVAAPTGLVRWSGQARIVVLGHTHHPFVAQTPAKSWSTKNFLQSLVAGGAERPPILIVNPGSVGQPRDGDSRASYAIIDFSTRSVELRRVEYDILAAARAILDAGLPSALAWRLEKGS